MKRGTIMGKTMRERYNESMDNLMKMFGKMFLESDMDEEAIRAYIILKDMVALSKDMVRAQEETIENQKHIIKMLEGITEHIGV